MPDTSFFISGLLRKTEPRLMASSGIAENPRRIRKKCIAGYFSMRPRQSEVESRGLP